MMPVWIVNCRPVRAWNLTTTMKATKRNASSDGENFFKFFTFFTGQFLHNNSKFLHCLVLIPFFHLFTDNKTKACSQAREKISRTDNNFRGWGRFTHRRTLPHSDAASLTIVLRSAELEIEIDSYQQLFLKLPNSSVVKSSETWKKRGKEELDAIEWKGEFFAE